MLLNPSIPIQIQKYQSVSCCTV